MARPIRVEYPYAIYHVISRGIRRDNIYREDDDKEKFLEKLKETKEKYNIEVFCYCLMDNHYHLLIRTPLGNLTKTMHYLNASYTNWVKAKHDIVGPVFQGRYKSILIEDESYLLTLSSYIHLNPLRADMVDKLEDCKYNSFNEYIDKLDYEIVDKDFILRKFENIEAYKDFIYEWYDENGDIDKEEIYGMNGLLGSKRFVEKIIKKIGEDEDKKNLEEYSNVNINPIKKEDIEKLMIKTFDIKKEKLYKKSYGNDYRNMFIYLLKKYTGMKLIEIGELFNIRYTSVSMKTKRFKEKCKRNKSLNKKKNKIEGIIKKNV